jgi:predicted DNA-binding transcriptional regulator AlpA
MPKKKKKRSRLIPLTALREEKGITYSRVRLWQMFKAGEFPLPIKFNGVLAFSEAEVDRWIEDRLSERRRVEDLRPDVEPEPCHQS